MTTLWNQIFRAGLIVAAVAGVGWFLFGVRTSESKVKALLPRQFPIGINKQTAIQVLKRLRWDWTDCSSTQYPTNNPDDLGYHAHSYISAGVPNIGPWGYWGHIDVVLSFDSHERLFRHETKQYYSGMP